MNSKRSNPVPITSTRKLAALVARSHTQIQRWLKDERWPFARKAPWSADDVPQILRWVADHLRETTGGQVSESVASIPRTRLAELKEKKLEAEIRKLEAQADAAEMELQRIAGELLSSSEVQEKLCSAFLTTKNQLFSLPQRLSIELEGRDQVERQEIIANSIAETVGLLASNMGCRGIDTAAERETNAVAVG